MQATASPSLADKFRSLSTSGTRDHQLYRFIDFYAVTEAAGALHHVALATHEYSAVTDALIAAEAILAATVDREQASDTASAREKLRAAITTPEFSAAVAQWTRQLRDLAATQPATGACTIASALKLWTLTLDYFTDAEPHIIDELGEVLCPLLAARCMAADVATAGAAPDSADAELRRDLCHVYAAQSAARAGTACAELVFGYRRHLVWDAEGCSACFDADEIDNLEAFMPGISAGVRMCGEVIEQDGAHVAKAGPCASFHGLDTFMALRRRLDGCLTGARIAKERAASIIEKSFSTEAEAR